MPRRKKTLPQKPAPERKLRAALYGRVSTDEQASEGQSIDAQLRITRAFAEARGWTVVKKYVDPGSRQD